MPFISTAAPKPLVPMYNIQQLGEIYNNEQVLLILLARLYFAKSNKDEVESFVAQGDIKWGLVYKMARAHQVRSFLYHMINHFKLSVHKI